jgi:hypothetical protein
MAPLVFRTLSISDSISVSGVVLTVVLSILALAIAYATFKLQQYMQRRYRRAHQVFELEALIPDSEPEV